MSNVWKKVIVFKHQAYSWFIPKYTGKIIAETESGVLVLHHIFFKEFAMKEKKNASYATWYIEYTIN